MQLHPVKRAHFFFDCVQILTLRRDRILESERWSTISHSLGNSLWTCLKTDYWM